MFVQDEAERPDPIITQELANWLADRYPAKVVGPHDTIEAAQRYAGSYDLASILIQMHADQLDTIVLTDAGEVTEQEPLEDALFLDLPSTANVSR